MTPNEKAVYRRSAKWRRLAGAAMTAAGGHCLVCGGDAEAPHHVNPNTYGREEPNDLVALCHDCHVMAHPGWGEREARESRESSREYRRDVTR